MNRTLALLTSAIVIGMGLAGCIGKSAGVSPASTAGLTKTSGPARTTATTGAVTGVLTTKAVEPISGAAVTLVETNQTGVSAQDGTYVVSNVKPGDYTVAVVKEGFRPVTHQVTVAASNIAKSDFVLLPVDSTLPYVVSEEFNGYTSCAIATPALTSTGGCDNANDKLEYYTNATVDLRTIVAEQKWGTTDKMLFEISENPDPQGNPTGINKRAYGVESNTKGYIRIYLETGKLNDKAHAQIPLPPPNATYQFGTRTFFLGQGADTIGPATQPIFCAQQPITNGTPAGIFGCPKDNVNAFGVGAVTSLSYHILLTTFYIDPGPGDYTAFKGAK